MADFDLTQTDQQVQNILNDAQGAMGASAQTTLTTEYVMLKDTNGVYHKILKSSFTEAIRDVLAGLLVNNDKGTTINQIAAIASGDFGSITPANLASVLGVGEMKQYPIAGGYIDDLNNMKPGTWSAASSTSTLNVPSDASESDKNYFCFGTEGSYLQVGGRNGIYHIRTFLNGSWGSWVKI